MRNLTSLACAVAISILTLLSGFAQEAKVAQAPGELRVITYNIHHGEGNDGKVDLARIARVITENHADLAAIQEVDVNTRRVPRNEPAELARLTGMHASFGKAIDYQGGDYGQVILSRFPVSDVRTVKLPSQPTREQRIAMMVRVHPGHGHQDFEFVSTHLDHQLEKDRIAQAQRLMEELEKTSKIPAILCGDFNAVPTRDSMKVIFAHFDDTARGDAAAPTIPAEAPTHKIDYVLTSKNGPWKVLSTRVLDEPMASDHRPVFTQLSW